MIKKFNQLYEEQIARDHIPQQLEQLYRCMSYPASLIHQEWYNKIDDLQWKAFRYADKRCRRLRMGEVAFEPETMQLEGKRISLWTLVIRRKAGRHVGTKAIRRLAAACMVERPL